MHWLIDLLILSNPLTSLVQKQKFSFGKKWFMKPKYFFQVFWLHMHLAIFKTNCLYWVNNYFRINISTLNFSNKFLKHAQKIVIKCAASYWFRFCRFISYGKLKFESQLYIALGRPCLVFPSIVTFYDYLCMQIKDYKVQNQTDYLMSADLGVFTTVMFLFFLFHHLIRRFFV